MFCESSPFDATLHDPGASVNDFVSGKCTVDVNGIINLNPGQYIDGIVANACFNKLIVVLQPVDNEV